MTTTADEVEVIWNDTKDIVEAIARIIDPSNWQEHDSRKRRRAHFGRELADIFINFEQWRDLPTIPSMTKAREIVQLFIVAQSADMSDALAKARSDALEEAAKVADASAAAAWDLRNAAHNDGDSTGRFVHCAEFAAGRSIAAAIRALAKGEGK